MKNTIWLKKATCIAVLLGMFLVFCQRPPCESLPFQKDPQLANRANRLFMGLSDVETQQVVDYLMGKPHLKLVPGVNASISSNYIYSIENFIPRKSQVISWLDGKKSRIPMRMARVILFLGETKRVLDLIVAPIPNPSYHAETNVNRKGDNGILWGARPVGTVEGKVITSLILTALQPLTSVLDKMVSNHCDSYFVCGTTLYLPRSSMDSDNRHFLISLVMSPKYFKAYYVLPLPFYMVISYTDDGRTMKVREFFYNGMPFDSSAELLAYYQNNSSNQVVLPKWTASLRAFGSPDYQNLVESADDVRRPPAQFYPDGQRFRVDKHHVEWLKWSFNIHTRTVAGLQLFDLRFNGERIAYEISIQDIAITYSGFGPDDYFKTIIDNGFGTGRLSSPLIRGVDCPEGATYLNASVFHTEFDVNRPISDAICIFEHRNSVPLRHHYSSDFHGSYRFAFSMPDTVLIVRQILTVVNYDYIYDIELHQNGVVEVKVSSTGYIQMASQIPSKETKYGMLLNPSWKTTGLFHQHLFNFKFDVDIGSGECNSFKTMNFGVERSESKYANGEPWYVPVVDETTVEFEEDAKIRFDFDQGKQYVIHQGCDDEVSDTKYGYRVHSKDFTKLLLPEDSPLIKGALSWAKYQLAVTKHNDGERSTASFFTQANPMEPDVNFDSFTADNNRIVDTDLVVWVTVGLNHLPTNEDLPVTTTSGKTLSASLFPFNFFERDPSIHSRDGSLFYNMRDFENDYLHWNQTCRATITKPSLTVSTPDQL